MTHLALVVFFFAELLVVFGALAAHKEKFFTVSEMQSRGIKTGLPFAMHLGMWGDFLLISPLVALMTFYYSGFWTHNEFVLSCAGAVIVSAVLHYLYTKIEIPESHVVNGTLTKAGCFHFLYVILVFTILNLFYFFTPSLGYQFFVLASVLILIHVLVSNHVIWEIIRPAWYSKSHFKDSLFILSMIVLIALLAWRCYALFA